MELTCKSCPARFRAAISQPLAAPVRLLCPACGKSMVLRPPSRERRESSQTSAIGSDPTHSRKRRAAFVADEDRPFRAFLGRQLAEYGFDVAMSDDGEEALAAIRSGRPDLAVLNVYLKGTLGVEITEEIRRDPRLESTRVLLIGALFRANRFRANPTNLYGADEYIEEQIPAKELRQIIAELFPDAEHIPVHEAGHGEEDEARRLARLILSDIVIYNTERTERGILEGSFFELLADEIREGREYFATRIPERVKNRVAIFNETLEQFVEMKRDELERVNGGGR